MRLEIRSTKSHTLSHITATQVNPKNPRSSEEKPRSWSKIPRLAPLAKSFWKYQKGNETYQTG